MQKVLVALRSSAHARRLAEQFTLSGNEVIVVESCSEANQLAKTFDRGVFGFDLKDGSGIVLAARLLAEDRLRAFDIVHPDDEVDSESPPGVQLSPWGSTDPGARLHIPM
jgi:hypothetical protein